ncbi:hypothetical protein ADL12_19985 [Streptomyces regalis]|uniref:Histidine kinase/HSP90-like ATPase domain-containing protein n=1 Tax=Streptomyces regalis TaxID=68262 RepID=A0A0X3USF5_9ACTN|nr:hypothetical protein ADL12_19985 [Streptomyces regalis]
MGPNAVAQARETVTEALSTAGVPARSAFADTAVLVVSELVTNVLRHATRSPVMDVGTALDAGQLVITVVDTDPRLPDLTPDDPGAGLRMVAELAGTYGGDVSAEPAHGHDGKVVRVRFRIPS